MMEATSKVEGANGHGEYAVSMPREMCSGEQSAFEVKTTKCVHDERDTARRMCYDRMEMLS